MDFIAFKVLIVVFRNAEKLSNVFLTFATTISVFLIDPNIYSVPPKAPRNPTGTGSIDHLNFVEKVIHVKLLLKSKLQLTNFATLHLNLCVTNIKGW